MQFHPEVDADIVEDWGAVPDYVADLEGALGAAGRARFEADVRAALPRLTTTASRLYDAFIRTALAPPAPAPGMPA